MKLNIKNKLTIFVLFIFCSSLAMASNSVSDALLASKNNNDIEAAEIWSQLAAKGNTIAMYNLANRYSSGKGIDKDKKLSVEWLKNAARSGLVEAYLSLNSTALSSAEGLHLSFNSGPLYWLKNKAPDKYTIQLASSRNIKSIKNIYSKNNLKGKGGYYHYLWHGKDRYALVYGAYETVTAANVALANLPEELRKSPPWVRKIQSLHNISQ